MTDWAKAQREDPVLNAVLNWLEAQKKTDLKTLLGEHASSEEGQLVWQNHQNFTTLQNALYLHSMPKGENRRSTTLCGAKGALGYHSKMGVIEMQDTKAMTVPYPYYKNAFGGQGWPTRYDNLLGPAHSCLQYEGCFPKAPLHPIVATTPLGSPAC